MENWGTEEVKKKESDIARKVIIVMIILLIIIIATIMALLYTIKLNKFTITIDGKTVSNSSNLLLDIENTTYVNIEKLAQLLGYDYHIGEYKIYSSDEDKCYIQSKEETASFYLNSNKICKLKLGNLTEDYEVFNSEKSIISSNNIFYAPIDAIEIGFNVDITSTKNSFVIITLDTLVKSIDASISEIKFNGEQRYKSLLDISFDNKKAMLYDYVIISKTNSNLYGVITTDNKEILSDKYTSITFLENTKEFLVKNSSGKMGIIDNTGRNKVEQIYDSIKLINKEPKLYLVTTSQKYGVIDENGNTIVYPEYDSIGIKNDIYKDIQNQYVLLNKVIPVFKENKYGLFDVEGNKVLDVIYNGIGCELQSAEVNGVNKAINPVVEIIDCNAIVIKNGEVYDLYFPDDKKLVPLKVSSIYYLTSEGKKDYYMVYEGNELNLIERLIKANVIKDNSQEKSDEDTNTIINNIQDSNTLTQ